MKQFMGIWKPNYSSGDEMILDFTPFGSAMGSKKKIIHEDTIIFSMKSLWGYDKNRDKIINEEIDSSLPDITIATCWVTSKNTVETENWVSPDSGDTLRCRYEFKTADLLLFTTINNNKDIATYKFTSVGK